MEVGSGEGDKEGSSVGVADGSPDGSGDGMGVGSGWHGPSRISLKMFSGHWEAQSVS